MINLLLPNEKTAPRTEYRLRVAPVAFAAFFFVMIIALASLYPSYVSVLARKNVLENEAKINADALRNNEKDVDITPEEMNKEIDILNDHSTETHAANVFAEIVSLMPKGVSISGMKYVGGPVPKVMITGVAKTRNSLLLLSDTLKKKTFFSGVNLPLSSLINENDLFFTINLEVRSEASIP